MIGEIFLPFNHPKSDVIQLSKVVNHLFKQTIAETQIKIHNIQPSTPPPLRQGNSRETDYQYSAINLTAASPAIRKLERSTLRLIVQQLQRHINLFPLIQLSHDLHPLALLSFQAQGIESSDWNNLLSLKFLSKSCFEIVCILTMLYCTTSSLHSNRVNRMLFYGNFLLQKLSLIQPSHCAQSKAGVYSCYPNS